MAEGEVDESVLRADRWSKFIALGCAIGFFLVAGRLTGDSQFSMIVAAFTGVGVRIYVPYHASVTVTGPNKEPIQAYDETGDYHYGAVGIGIVAGSLVALGTMVSVLDSMPALAVGGVAGFVLAVALREILPS